VKTQIPEPFLSLFPLGEIPEDAEAAHGLAALIMHQADGNRTRYGYAFFAGEVDFIILDGPIFPQKGKHLFSFRRIAVEFKGLFFLHFLKTVS
jgi:hypothetical protein